jgi:hypothetical protein
MGEAKRRKQAGQYYGQEGYAPPPPLEPMPPALENFLGVARAFGFRSLDRMTKRAARGRSLPRAKRER